MDRFPRVVVDLAALSHNLKVIRDTAPGCRIMAVIKANAYGHGLVAAARALKQADALAVARIGEAVQLREAGISNEIVLLEGVFSPAELSLAARHDFTLVVHEEQQLRWLEKWSGEHRFGCWLKIDTGMNRLGFGRVQRDAAMDRIRRCEAVRGVAGLMTHLASAEIGDDSLTSQQIRVFDRLADDWPGEVSIANSAAILARPATRRGWLRPGLALYGVSPLPGQTGADLGLRAAMRLETRLIAVRQLEAGDSVGYNSIWTATEPTRVGIAAVGYGDGYLRCFAPGTPVLVGGAKAGLVGRVSMDMIAVELGPTSAASVGDPVLLWGNELPVEEVAGCAGTIPYELLCNVSARVYAEYLSQPEAFA